MNIEIDKISTSDTKIIFGVLSIPLFLLFGFLSWNMIFGPDHLELAKQRDLPLEFKGKIDSLYFDEHNHNVKVAVLSSQYEFHIARNWERYLVIGDSLLKKKGSFETEVYRNGRRKIILDYTDFYTDEERKLLSRVFVSPIFEDSGMLDKDAVLKAELKKLSTFESFPDYRYHFLITAEGKIKPSSFRKGAIYSPLNKLMKEIFNSYKWKPAYQTNNPKTGIAGTGSLSVNFLNNKRNVRLKIIFRDEYERFEWKTVYDKILLL
jgi:uncharacterized protein YaiE (UPF0345 family)